MSNGIFLKNIVFNDDTEMELNEDSIVLITGPNNSGKSQIIRDISRFIYQGKVIKHLEVALKGTMRDIVRDAVLNKFDEISESFIDKFMENWNGNIMDFIHEFDSREDRFDLLGQLMHYVSTDSRTEGVEPNDRPRSGNKLFRAIHESKTLEKKLHDLIKTTFGTGIVANRESFDDRSLRFISEDDLVNAPVKGESDFARWLEQQPELEAQGDGVRAFCTVILTVLTELKALILIDEPEAFLHPPQARRLARSIALDAPQKTQVFIATHSNDFVQGLLDYATDRVIVLRIVRETKNSKINRVYPLNPAEVVEFWKDPLLKTSDALTSLFHDVAIIVEGDSDARFFRAIFDAVYKDSSEYLPDMRFFHCGGKDRIAKIASALKSAGVPVVCEVDIDALDNKNKFLELYRVFGGIDEKIPHLLDGIGRCAASRRSPVTSSEAKRQIDVAFEKIDPKQPIPTEKVVEISDIIKNFSTWKYIKSNGENFFSGGSPYNDFNDICYLSQNVSIFINRHGELENLCKTVPPRKGEWLAAVLQKDLANDPDLESARAFAKDLLAICKKALD